jgi:hypothetical protein
MNNAPTNGYKSTLAHRRGSVVVCKWTKGVVAKETLEQKHKLGSELAMSQGGLFKDALRTRCAGPAALS